MNFEYGRGYKLIGDHKTGDVGHFANAVHPESEILQNASFNMRGKKIFQEGRRGKFKIIAKAKISQGEEIIVNYGCGYWLTLQKWYATGCVPMTKKTSTLKREERWNKRHVDRAASI